MNDIRSQFLNSHFSKNYLLTTCIKWWTVISLCEEDFTVEKTLFLLRLDVRFSDKPSNGDNIDKSRHWNLIFFFNNTLFSQSVIVSFNRICCRRSFTKFLLISSFFAFEASQTGSAKTSGTFFKYMGVQLHNSLKLLNWQFTSRTQSTVLYLGRCYPVKYRKFSFLRLIFRTAKTSKVANSCVIFGFSSAYFSIFTGLTSFKLWKSRFLLVVL